MKQNKGHLLAIRDIVQNMGEGSVVAVYNDTEQKWYHYVGRFKAANPSNHIYFSSIEGKCIDYILENHFTYFAGELAKNELIATKIQDLPTEYIEFDFKFIWFK